MTARHPDAGGLSVEEIALEEEICRDVLSRYPHDRQLLRTLTLCAMARQSLVMAQEIKDLKLSVCAFAAPYAESYARAIGLPRGHLHPTHYDVLAKAGARMDDFTRAALAPTQSGGEGVG